MRFETNKTKLTKVLFLTEGKTFFIMNLDLDLVILLFLAYKKTFSCLFYRNFLNEKEIEKQMFQIDSRIIEKVKTLMYDFWLISDICDKFQTNAV